MRRELVRNALALLRRSPGAGMISISQNDCQGNCRCEKCKAIEEEEGAPSGLMIRFVNAVAEQIEKESPNVLVETLAYQYTRKPPRHARPRGNVVVRLCSIECSFVQPLALAESGTWSILWQPAARPNRQAAATASFVPSIDIGDVPVRTGRDLGPQEESMPRYWCIRGFRPNKLHR